MDIESHDILLIRFRASASIGSFALPQFSIISRKLFQLCSIGRLLELTALMFLPPVGVNKSSNPNSLLLSNFTYL